MPRGDKSKLQAGTKADHIAESYEKRGISSEEAERRGWAAVNKDDAGGKKAGSGRGATPAIRPRRKVARLVGRRQLRAPLPNARPLPGR